MPFFIVTEEKTIVLTHIIEAADEQQAKLLMSDPLHKGLKDILEDDSSAEYETNGPFETLQAARKDWFD